MHQKTLNRLVKFIDEFKQLNFAGDQVMEAELERVRQAFLNRTAEEYRDSGFAQTNSNKGCETWWTEPATGRAGQPRDCRAVRQPGPAPVVLAA